MNHKTKICHSSEIALTDADFAEGTRFSEVFKEAGEKFVKDIEEDLYNQDIPLFSDIEANHYVATISGNQYVIPEAISQEKPSKAFPVIMKDGRPYAKLWQILEYGKKVDT